MKTCRRRRTPVALTLAVAAVGLGAGTASAQLPELPKLPLPVQVPQPQQTVERLVQPVQQVVQSPLPAPVEQVVQNSPVAPLRDTVREVVGSPGSGLPSGNLPGGGLLPGGGSGGGNLPGGGVLPGSSSGGGGSGGGSSGDGSRLRAETGPGSGSKEASPASPAAEGGARGGVGTRGLRRGESRDRRADRRARRAERIVGRRMAGGRSGSLSGSTSAQTAPAGAELAAAGREPTQTAEQSASIVRTVTDIVEVVPGAVWSALGLITLLALMFLGRAVVERRRSGALRREREHLLRDMGLLERVLLPRVPERMGDLAVSVAYRPAAGPAAGGDFYDVFELSDGRVGFFVGDVSGHGREALDGTSALRPRLRGHLEAGLSPRAALEAAGRAAGIDPAGRFTTAVVAVHDPVAGRLTYAQAGHPPPVLVGPGAHEPVIVASSPPIGVGIQTGMRQTTVPLPRGSSACFVTDGLLEARTGGTLLGREWLESVVSAFGPLDSAEGLLDRVLEAADVASDDLTACLVRAVDGPTGAGPRVEELELGPDGVGAPGPGRFLEACGVPAEAVEDVLADAYRLAAQAGKALLTVTIDGGEPSIQVTAPTREALATT
jgi:Stage II sporulation protein E (SpoIIE)